MAEWKSSQIIISLYFTKGDCRQPNNTYIIMIITCMHTQLCQLFNYNSVNSAAIWVQPFFPYSYFSWPKYRILTSISCHFFIIWNRYYINCRPVPNNIVSNIHILKPTPKMLFLAYKQIFFFSCHSTFLFLKSPLRSMVNPATQASSFQMVVLSISCAMLTVQHLLYRIYWILSWYCFQNVLSPLVTIPIVPMITSITKQFIFHILWISIDFCILIFQFPSILHSYSLVLLHPWVSKFYLPYF